MKKNPQGFLSDKAVRLESWSNSEIKLCGFIVNITQVPNITKKVSKFY